MANRTPLPELVFRNGDEFFAKDGSSVRRVTLGILGGASLPAGMRCHYEAILLPDATIPAANVVLEARSKHGRRYQYFADENDAQRAILKWARRILRERARQDAARAKVRSDFARGFNNRHED